MAQLYTFFMEENVKSIKSKSLISFISLLFQSGYAALLGLAANLILTILLTPAIYGMYITVLALISLLNYFSDIGLAASLIRKKTVSENDIKTTFTVQQILIVTLIAIGFILTSSISSFYNLPKEGIYLYWALLASFFISSLKTIPSVFLERKIKFHRIVFVQIIENTIFYISVSLLAYMGYGLTSFTISVLLRAVVGLVLIYSVSFWIPRIGISLKSLKELLAFGFPFQANSFLALFKDDLITLFLGKVIGFEGLGYIGWAKKWAEAPLRIIMDNLTKVLFPLIAKIQDNKEKISRVFNNVIYFQTTLLAPLMTLGVFLMPHVVYLIPKYSKWAPALPFFYIFVLSSFLVTYSAPFISLFNSLGKVKISFVFMLVWTTLIWLLTPLFTREFGLYGFPLAHLSLSLSFIFVVLTVKKFIRINLFSLIYKPIISTVIMGIVLVLLTSTLPETSFLSAGLLLSTGSMIYFLSMLLIFKTNLITDTINLFVRKELKNL